MDMDSISALLEALKRAEGKARDGMDFEGDGKPIAAKISVIKAEPIGARDAGQENQSDMDQMDMFRGMANGIEDEGHDKELRNYAPPPVSNDSEYEGAQREDYPKAFSRLMARSRG